MKKGGEEGRRREGEGVFTFCRDERGEAGDMQMQNGERDLVVQQGLEQ